MSRTIQKDSVKVVKLKIRQMTKGFQSRNQEKGDISCFSAIFFPYIKFY